MKTSRRSFIKSAAAGMGTAGLGGLGVREARATQSDQIGKWDYEAEVVVLGIGGAGLVTSIVARDKGADVLILEKATEAHAGGNTRVSGQGYWCPSDFNNSVAYQNAMSDGYPIPDDVTRVFHERSIHITEWLEKTVARWNKSCALGNDSEFGRPANKMAPIQTSPYYAAEFVPAFTNTQGGPRRNSAAQVLDTKRKPIPRLYSAGELGSVFSYHYQGGGNIAECIFFGQIAGEHAASEKPWA